MSENRIVNVLLIISDSLRAKNLSCYGHVNNTTPFLDSWQKEVTRYEQARAPGPDSITSHVSMFTGYSVPEHDLVSGDSTLDPGHTIWEELANIGYETGVFTSNPFFVDRPIGLTHGFITKELRSGLPLFPSGLSPREYSDRDSLSNYYKFAVDAIEDRTPVRSFVNGLLRTVDQLPANQTETANYFSSKFLEWQKDREGPWAAFINLMDTHTPYYTKNQNSKWGSRREKNIQDQIDQQLWDFVGGNKPWWQRSSLECLYDDTIRRVDSAMERIVTTLKKRDEYEDTLIVFTGDHGEGFGEESRIRNGERVSEHSQGIHEVLLHVPLLVKYPGQAKSYSINEVVSLTEFPEVVRSSVNGVGEASDFISDEPVLAVGPGVDRRPGMLKNAKEYCGDRYENFIGDAYAVYTNSEEGIKKHIQWKEKNTTIFCESAQISYRTDPDDTQIVDSVVNHKTNRNVISGEDAGEIDKKVEDRLKELGYR